MSHLAPIALFTYNRPLHTQQTLDALAANPEAKESVLYVFSEGPKKDASVDLLEKIKEVRRIVNTENRFKEVIVKEQVENLGLASSVIKGVTDILNTSEKIIVLEDDLVTSPHFLKFMNDALNAYAPKEKLACISGYIYPVNGKLPETFFIKGADCWGWATWKRAWNDFEKDGSKLLKELQARSLTAEFDFKGSYPYTQMLKDQIDGKNSSWAIRWYASAFLKNKYCLYPGTSLVQNIGIDGSGTHSGSSNKWDVNLASKSIDVVMNAIAEDQLSKQLIINYFKTLKIGQVPFGSKLKSKARMALNSKWAIKIVRILRKIYSKIFRSEPIYGATYEYAKYSNQAAADLIKEKLTSSKPLMVARFGSVELDCVLNYHFMKMDRSFYWKVKSYIKGRIGSFWLEESSLKMMCNNAGFFPEDEKLLEKFYERMMQDMNDIDVLGSWLKEEKFLSEHLSAAVQVRLPDLEPYYHTKPWTAALKGKKVLLIHPYAESIQAQYKKRELLFKNPDILPEFELKTIKAVQSIAGEKTEYPTWFDALDAMCERVSATDFDIAIIGCGAYGLPLAAHVKRIGKKAIHIGGATQILFGIKGKRWEDHDFISGLMNEHWVRPSANEVPTNHSKVEDGCYW